MSFLLKAMWVNASNFEAWAQAALDAWGQIDILMAYACKVVFPTMLERQDGGLLITTGA